MSRKQPTPEFDASDRIKVAQIMQAYCKAVRMANVEKRNFTLQTPFQIRPGSHSIRPIHFVAVA
jgi:hypothetical protein